VVIRRDAGGRQFNYSEFLGAAAGAGISTTYRDRADQTFSNASETYVEQIAIDALGNELKEFWPDIHRIVFTRIARKLHGQSDAANNV